MTKLIMPVIVTAALLSGVKTPAAGRSCRQGIDSLVNSARSITAFPNPVAASLRVQSVKRIRELVIYAMDGRQVKQFRKPGNDNMMRVADLQQGPYLLRATFEDGTGTSKMIIKQ
ncbi:T9SS type A sorting domain-containing protein [Chitinophaga solisilvae]|uniref:T9SS type A sorting domain-containing protein n=1 Tax=Chitinophaga solisilvae TaxID=1233460 RepID=A0A3S1B003_9BACT|nr:T9SS type A sorting domain-containing protein [Chitinophaga solisilvae]NSL90393.1 T9SS type A sorting domain-containing protein [Chitinophaga solisilvae]